MVGCMGYSFFSRARCAFSGLLFSFNSRLILLKLFIKDRLRRLKVQAEVAEEGKQTFPFLDAATANRVTEQSHFDGVGRRDQQRFASRGGRARRFEREKGDRKVLCGNPHGTSLLHA